MLRAELCSEPLHLDECNQIPVDANPVVGKLTLDRVLCRELAELVVAETVGEDAVHDHPRIAFVGVAFDQIIERLREAWYSGLYAVARLNLPPRSARSRHAGGASVTVGSSSVTTIGGASAGFSGSMPRSYET